MSNNVSEPVLSFVKVFQNNPKRFKIEMRDEGTLFGSVTFIDVHDTYTKYTFNLRYRTETDRYYFGDKLSFLTYEEKKYLIENAIKWYTDFINKRQQKVHDWKNNKKRKRLKKVYCDKETESLKFVSIKQETSKNNEVAEKKKELDKKLKEVENERKKLQTQIEGYKKRPFVRYVIFGVLIGNILTCTFIG